MDTTFSHIQDVATAPQPDLVRIVATPDVRCGKPRIDGHRIAVAYFAVWHERQGLNPDEILDGHPAQALSDVHAAPTYDFDNRDRIDADILQRKRRAEQLRAEQPSILETPWERAIDARATRFHLDENRPHALAGGLRHPVPT